MHTHTHTSIYRFVSSSSHLARLNTYQKSALVSSTDTRTRPRAHAAHVTLCSLHLSLSLACNERSSLSTLSSRKRRACIAAHIRFALQIANPRRRRPTTARRTYPARAKNSSLPFSSSFSYSSFSSLYFLCKRRERERERRGRDRDSCFGARYLGWRAEC